MGFVGGDAQALFVDQVRGLDPEQCLLVPIDVGKTTDTCPAPLLVESRLFEQSLLVGELP